MNQTVFEFDSGTMTLFMISYIISMLVSLGATALILVSNWHIFKKLGMPGWKGIIPFYSDFMLYKTVWKTKPFWVLVISAGVYYVVSVIAVIVMAANMVMNADNLNSADAVAAILLPFAIVFGFLTLALMVISLVIGIKLCVRLAKTFGKGVGFALGLAFISVVFYPILAFGKAQRVQ